jgi:hypothetical protein
MDETCHSERSEESATLPTRSPPNSSVRGLGRGSGGGRVGGQRLAQVGGALLRGQGAVDAALCQGLSDS